jgi:lipopolysaccharide transport system permease protein
VITVIRPTSGWRALDLRELWRYHELLYFLAWRDIKVRYKQTVLGAAWAILQPVMTMLVFTVFFGRLGGMAQNPHITAAYPIFVYAALLPWQFFATSLQQGGQSLVSSANLISKVYFPRLIVPLASAGAALVDLAISFAVMFALMVYYDVPFTARLLALPLCLAGTVVAATGVGTLLAALTVSFRDFRYVVPFMVQIWMFASPVAYPFEAVPEQWRLLYAVNPMAGIISAYRSALLDEPFLWDAIAVSLLSATLIFAAGLFYFRRVERRFADIV